MPNYLKRVGTATTILLNVLSGGASNQTFSARNFQWFVAGKPNLKAFIDFLFSDETHCSDSYVTWVYLDKALKKYKEKQT